MGTKADLDAAWANWSNTADAHGVTSPEHAQAIKDVNAAWDRHQPRGGSSGASGANGGNYGGGCNEG